MAEGGLCQYSIYHFHAGPGSGDGTLEPCILRVLSAPNHNRNPGNNGAVNTVEG
jgi:hypothetical protein